MIFPTPTYVGQPVTYQGRSWFWNSVGWQVAANQNQVVSTFVAVDQYVQLAVEELPFLEPNTFTQLTYV